METRIDAEFGRAILVTDRAAVDAVIAAMRQMDDSLASKNGEAEQ